MNFVIYKCTNLVNGKVYIGKTVKGLKTRIKTHKADWKNSIKKGDNGKPLYNAFSKYGFENFLWETIDTAQTEEELNQKEIYWINQCEALVDQKGYNVNPGGEGGDNFSRHPDKENIRRKLKQRKHPPITEEHKKKLKEGRKRFVQSNRYQVSLEKQKISLKKYYETHISSMKGTKRSQEEKDKISQTLKGRFSGKANPNFGNKWTDKQKEALSKKQKERGYGGSKNPNSKSVRYIDVETGIIETFSCRAEFCSKYGVKYDTAEQNSRQRKLVKKRFLEIPEDLEVSIEELVKIVKENSRWYRLKQ